jgi:hypothetical protein
LQLQLADDAEHRSQEIIDAITALFQQLSPEVKTALLNILSSDENLDFEFDDV